MLCLPLTLDSLVYMTRKLIPGVVSISSTWVSIGSLLHIIESSESEIAEARSWMAFGPIGPARPGYSVKESTNGEARDPFLGACRDEPAFGVA